MKKKTFGLLLVLSVSSLIFITCTTGKSKKLPQVNPEFGSYIRSFTSGVISVKSDIKIRFTQELSISGMEPGKELDSDIFRFTPKVKGKTIIEDKNTLVFRPAKPMKPDTRYDVSLALYHLFEVPESLKYFEFGYNTLKQSFQVSTPEFSPYSPKELRKNKLTGYLIMADAMDDQDAMKIISARQDGRDLPVRWESGGETNKFGFIVDSILRSETSSQVVLTWNGNPLDIDIKGADTIRIPALGDFSVMEVKVIQQPSQALIVQFSDPLEEGQNLDGMIRFDKDVELKFEIESNIVRAYPVERLAGTRNVFIESGIKNVLDFKMKDPYSVELLFEELKPEVRLIGNGVIVPGSEGLIFPFEAVSLNAVDIKVTEIFEKNIKQFLQVNSLDGMYELYRVGKPVYSRKIALNTSAGTDAGKWNAYSVDLADIVGNNPGAIYSVTLSFKKEYSLFRCNGEAGSEPAGNESSFQTSDEETEGEYWDYYDDYYYYPPDYDWQERDNPCHNSYYNSSRWARRNVFASNIGIIAKGVNDKIFKVAVTDIRTTEPIGNVTLEIFDYQQQKIAEVTTNSEGMAEIELSEKPYLLVANRGNEKGYLRLDDGSSLSVSMWDVSGDVVQQGIKGFIYGERGVWRPGDTLFLTFILEDKSNVIPENHPVKFEMINSRGQVVNTLVKTKGLNGFYSFITQTETNAPTGIWTAHVQVGGSDFRKNIRIETVKPNRLKLKLDYGTEVIGADQKDIQGILKVHWLHGAVAKNLKANVTLTLNPVSTEFKGFKGFSFDDETKQYYPEEQVIFDGRTDNSGQAIVKSDLGSPSNAPGMLKAGFMVRAFEEGGDFSSDFFSLSYAPYKKFVGIKIPETRNNYEMFVTDSTYTAQIAAVDYLGNPVSADNLEVRLYKLRWRWWWDVSYENLGNYVTRNYEDLISVQKIDVTNGKGSYSFKISYPDWGRYMIRVSDPEGGHSATQIFYADWPSWVSRDKRKQPEGAKVLSFSADKESYKVGETATVTIPTSGEGRALLSIETGSEILDACWILPEKNSKETRSSFTITEKMCPNIYIHCTYIQPHAQTANDLPVRLYGIVPVKVEDPSTILKPVISMNEELAPEKEFTVRVSEAQNKPMTYSLAIVDEGLLDLTRFKTPDPHAVFYAKEALGVKTWDLFDLILGAYGGKMEKLFAVGGDAGSIHKPNEKANRFKPVVMFLGPFELTGGSQTHKLVMPRYVGSVRTMVIAGQDGAYGFAEKTVPVKNPLMILGTLPRVLSPGETVTLPVTVFAMDKKVRDVNVEISANDLFIIPGESKKLVSFAEPGDKVIPFELKVSEKIGVGRVSIKAGSGNEKAAYDIEIDIRNPNPPVTQVTEKILQPGEQWTTEYLPLGMEGTNEGLLEISRIPPVDFGRRLKYLISYPYGCAEQTVSAVFPQLYLRFVMEMDQKMTDYTNRNIRDGIIRLQTMANTDGGFRYWSGHYSSDDWTSSYAGHFLVEAEALGYSIPAGMKEKWIKYQQQAARNWRSKQETDPWNTHHEQLKQAYRLYTLALAGSPDLSSMNRFREMPGIAQFSKWYLAASYALVGQTEVSKELISGLTMYVSDYDLHNATFGSPLRDQAIILETLVLMGEKDKAVPLVMDISKKISSEIWYSTQTTAYCLMALAKFAGKENLAGKEIFFEYDIDNKLKFSKRTQLPVSQIKMEIGGRQKGNIFVENRGNSMIYIRLALTGIPVTGQETFAENKLSLDVRYLNLDGSEIQPDKIPQGTDFIAEVKITNPGIYGYYGNMALTQVVPSGWEIINTRMADFPTLHESDKPDYLDIRDDRVNTFFGIGKISRKFTIMLNASYTGRFYLPSVTCQAMYDNSVYARIPGKWVEVVNPGR